MSGKPTFQSSDQPKPRPLTRREQFMATYSAALARLQAEGKLPIPTGNARQGTEAAVQNELKEAHEQ